MYFPHDTMMHTGLQENPHFGNLAKCTIFCENLFHRTRENLVDIRRKVQ